MTTSALQHVLNALHEVNFTIPSLIKAVLRSGPLEAQQSILEQSTQITNTLYEHSPDVMRAWAFGLVTQCLQLEVVELTKARHGLQFNIGQATSAYLEGSFMQVTAKTMARHSPLLWNLTRHLLDANPMSRRSCEEKTNSVGTNQAGDEGDSGDLLDGEAMELDDDFDSTGHNTSEGGECEGQGERGSKKAARNAKLHTIVSTKTNQYHLS